MDIQKLYEELLPHIPAMKDDPKLWKERIEAFVKAKPSTTPNAQFVAQLKESLLALTPKQRSTLLWPLITSIGSSAIVGTLVFILMVSPFGQQYQQKISSPLSQSSDNSPAPLLAHGENMSITEETEASFGTIDFRNNQNTANTEAATPSSRPQSGGGGDMTSSKMSELSIAPSPGYYGGERVNYQYDLPEQLPDLPQKSIIYRKDTSRLTPPSLNFLESFFADRLAFEQLSNSELQNVSLQTILQGNKYYTSVNFEDGQINLNQDYNSLIEPICPDPNRCALEPLQKKDLPTDDKLISTANTFLDYLGASRTNTLTPYVERSWLLYDPAQEFIPDTVYVVYPYDFEGKRVMENWNNAGIRIGINIRSMKISDASFPYLSLTSSAYPVPSSDTIQSMLTHGGLFGFTHNVPDKTIRIPTKNPRIELREVSIWDSEKQRNTTYYTEMLVLDTQPSKEQEYMIPREIIVPLAQQ